MTTQSLEDLTQASEAVTVFDPVAMRAAADGLVREFIHEGDEKFVFSNSFVALPATGDITGMDYLHETLQYIMMTMTAETRFESATRRLHDTLEGKGQAVDCLNWFDYFVLVKKCAHRMFKTDKVASKCTSQDLIKVKMTDSDYNGNDRVTRKLNRILSRLVSAHTVMWRDMREKMYDLKKTGVIEDEASEEALVLLCDHMQIQADPPSVSFYQSLLETDQESMELLTRFVQLASKDKAIPTNPNELAAAVAHEEELAKKRELKKRELEAKRIADEKVERDRLALVDSLIDEHIGIASEFLDIAKSEYEVDHGEGSWALLSKPKQALLVRQARPKPTGSRSWSNMDSANACASEYTHSQSSAKKAAASALKAKKAETDALLCDKSDDLSGEELERFMEGDPAEKTPAATPKLTFDEVVTAKPRLSLDEILDAMSEDGDQAAVETSTDIVTAKEVFQDSQVSVYDPSIEGGDPDQLENNNKMKIDNASVDGGTEQQLSTEHVDEQQQINTVEGGDGLAEDMATSSGVCEEEIVAVEIVDLIPSEENYSLKLRCAPTIDKHKKRKINRLPIDWVIDAFLCDTIGVETADLATLKGHLGGGALLGDGARLNYKDAVNYGRMILKNAGVLKVVDGVLTLTAGNLDSNKAWRRCKLLKHFVGTVLEVTLIKNVLLPLFLKLFPQLENKIFEYGGSSFKLQITVCVGDDGSEDFTVVDTQNVSRLFSWFHTGDFLRFIAETPEKSIVEL